MKSVVKEAIFISESERTFTDRESGEVRTYYKALFSQDGSEPLEVSIDDGLIGTFNRFGLYDIVLDINSYNRRFSVKLVEAHEC